MDGLIILWKTFKVLRLFRIVDKGRLNERINRKGVLPINLFWIFRIGHNRVSYVFCKIL